MSSKLEKISVAGFKSIKKLKDFVIKDLNVLIGANGAGKSNFIQIFRMLHSMTHQNLSKFINERGGIDDFLFNGPKVTEQIDAEFNFISYRGAKNAFSFDIVPTVDENFLITEYRQYLNNSRKKYGPPSNESRLKEKSNEKSSDGQWNGVGHFVYESISNWIVYHFHDTSATSPIRRSEIVEDFYRLRPDGANIAPLLLHLKENEEGYYKEIVNSVRLVTPFFDDFRLDRLKRGEKESVKLSWSQKGSDYPMQPYHFSDGSIRFICLATALLQPNPPSIIVIDEPELGLHPYAIDILAELIEAASQKTQVIISTQSPSLVSNFSCEDVIVVNRHKGQSTFKRLEEKDLTQWLDNYSLGELWVKNILAGGPAYE